MSNSLDPDQARHYVGPDLGPNYLQKLSADDNSRQRVLMFLKPSSPINGEQFPEINAFISKHPDKLINHLIITG